VGADSNEGFPVTDLPFQVQQLTVERHRDDEVLIRRRALAVAKHAARSVIRAPRDRRRLVLIFGCQRSGTSMLQSTWLDRSWRVLIVEETDRRLVGHDALPGETRWQDYPTVLRRLRRIPFEVVAAKPLVESDRALELMDAAPPVKAIWMLRRYEEVARSNINRFGEDNPYKDLRPFCNSDKTDWRSRGATAETRETITGLMRKELSPLDAAALFWWARNQLYFQQHLSSDDRVRIIRYERACNEPEQTARALSDFVGIALPAQRIASRVRSHPDRTEDIGLDPEVQVLCQTTWDSFAGCPAL
jgi:hypothetical protein